VGNSNGQDEGNGLDEGDEEFRQVDRSNGQPWIGPVRHQGGCHNRPPTAPAKGIEKATRQTQRGERGLDRFDDLLAEYFPDDYNPHNRQIDGNDRTDYVFRDGGQEESTKNPPNHSGNEELF